MRIFKYNEKAMMLISVLFLTTLLLMLTISMITIVSENTNITGKMDNKLKAIKAAEAGVEYAFYQINSDITWGDPALDPIFLNDVTENIGNNEEFTIIFTQTDPHYSKNNLRNNLAAGTVPAYSAEIICKGTYNQNGEKYSSLMRAIFVRDDILSYPMISEGNLYCLLDTSVPYKFEGVVGTDPARLHSNEDININRLGPATIDLNDGFISAGNTVTDNLPAGMIKKKEEVPKIKVPDMNIDKIIENRPPGCFIPPKNFYLIGFFEYSDGNYCVPHNGPGTGYDPNKVPGSTREFGIIAFTENSVENFFTNYIECNTQTFITSPEDKYLLNYYPDLKLYTPESLGLTVTFSGSDPEVPSFTLTTFSLTENFYIPDTFPFFAIYKAHRALPMGVNNYHIENTYVTNMNIDMNDKKIYSEKPVYLEFPITATGDKSAIISKDTIDFLHSYPLNLVVLSGKSVRLLESGISGGTLTRNFAYNGIIYAKDDIVLDKPPNGIWNNGGTIDYSINGRMISKDITPDNFTPSPMFPLSCFASWWSTSDINSYKSTNMFIKLDNTGNNVTITCSDEGIDNLVEIRDVFFNIRKKYSEILK